MQPRKVTFFALFLTSNIITMLVRHLVHGYKHDSATGFVCFACFPLSFGCPRIFLSGILKLVCFFTLFVFVTLGPAWGAEGGGILSLCFKDRSQSSFHAGWGGGVKTWVLPLIPICIISFFSSEYWDCLAWISPVRQGGNRCFTWLSPSAAGGGGGEYWKQLLPIPWGMGHPTLAHEQKWISEYSLSLFKDNVVLETMIFSGTVIFFIPSVCPFFCVVAKDFTA